MTSIYNKAEVKFNNGRGACLCNGCSYILSYGTDHSDMERYCADCYNKLADAMREIAAYSDNDVDPFKMRKIAREALKPVSYD